MAIPIYSNQKTAVRSPGIRPISVPVTLALFGGPGILIYLAVHFAVPRWVAAGLPLVFAWTIAVVGPTVLNALLVLAAYFVTERPTYRGFLERFRLQRPDKKILWLVPLTAVGIVLLNELLAWTVPLLSQITILAPPALVPEIFANVYESLDLGLANTTFMGEPIILENAWLIPFWLFFWVFLAAVGEEIVWRGYILPAHEAQVGRWAWVINALLWNIPFHLYTMHNFFSDMPLYFLLPLLVFRQKNTWYGIAVHSLLISLALVIVIPGLMR